MLSRIDNISFTSKIVKDKYFNEALKEARKDSKTSNGQDRTNKFINAIRYIENDGLNDYYSIKMMDRTNSNCHLLRNGIPVESAFASSTGRCVMMAYTDYVGKNLGIEISRPSVPTMIYRDSLKNAHARLDKVQEETDKTRSELNQLDKEVITPQIAEDLSNALNEFDIYI
ncbi:hypothetical protein J6A34_07110 [bacterium]|nr:hypothetical protein [bacterium]